MQRGNFSSWWENKRQQDQLELEQNQRLKGEIRRLDQSARQKANWSDQVEKTKIGAADKGYVGHKAAKMMKRAKAVESRWEKAIQEKEKLLRNIEKVDPLVLRPLRYHVDSLVRLEKVTEEKRRWDRYPFRWKGGSGWLCEAKTAVGNPRC